MVVLSRFLTKLELKLGVMTMLMAMTSDIMMLKCCQMEMSFFWSGKKLTQRDVQVAGVDFSSNIYTEKLIEVNPNTNQVEWEWRSWDHIVQEYDSNALNYDSVANNPQRININYNLKSDGDFMHANGLSYDADQRSSIHKRQLL